MTSRSRWDGIVRSRPSRARRFSQDATRHGVHMYDQHDREWGAAAENRSGMPTGGINPRFRAPWYPDQQYLVVNPENASELFIDYKRMYADRKGARDEYHAKVVKVCMANDWPVPEPGKWTPRVIAAVGYPSRPVEPVIAAFQGNPWILGFSKKPDPRLEALVPKRSEAIDEAAIGIDFGADSYATAIGGAFAEEILREGLPPAALDSEREDITDAAINPEETALDLSDVAEIETPDAEARLLEDALDIEDEADTEALGGRTVDPRKADQAARQAPRRPTQTAVRSKSGAARSAGQRPNQTGKGKGARPLPKRAPGDKRPSLADGAAPAITDAPDDE